MAAMATAFSAPACARMGAGSSRPAASRASVAKAFQGLKVSGASSSFMGASLAAAAPVRAARAGAAGGLMVEARYDAGVGVFGNKAGMTQLFTEDGLCVPVTVIAVQAGNVVTQVKTEDTDGYNAVQVGYSQVKDYRITKPEVGHCAKAGVAPMRHLEEFRLKATPAHTLGQQLNPTEMFKMGDTVDVRGTSIGKGWQGATKKYGFTRGPMAHGSKSHRQLGSIGAGTTPGRVYPGKKMHSQMGNVAVTLKQLKVMKVENDCIIVKGSVPGKRGNLLRICPAKVVGKF